MPWLIPFVPLIASGVGAAAGLISGNQANRNNQRVQGQMQQTQNRQMGLFDQANSLIPGMQNISQQYGQAAGGFLGDRAAVQGLNGQYAGLSNQYAGLGDQYGGLMGQMQRLYSQNSGGAPYAAGNISDGGASGSLMGNASGVLSATDPSVYQHQAQLAGNDAMGQLSSQLAGRGILGSGATSRLGASTLSRLYSNAAAQGQQDRLNAFGISNNALSSAGQMSLSQSNSQEAARLNAAQFGLAQQNQQSGMLGQMANLINGQAGILGQRAGLIGQQQQGVLAGSGLLGNYLSGTQNQFGMQQGIANQYNQQAGALGGMYQQQSSQINPNPYGGFGAALGSVGTAAAGYLGNQQQQQWLNNQQQPTMPAYQAPYSPYGGVGGGGVAPRYGASYR